MALSKTRGTRKQHKKRVAAWKKRGLDKMRAFYKAEQKRMNEAMAKYQAGIEAQGKEIGDKLDEEE